MKTLIYLLICSIVTAGIGFWRVQVEGNYETKYGAVLFLGVIATILSLMSIIIASIRYVLN